MTENEAINILKVNAAISASQTAFCDAVKVATDALEEIQQYRANGMVGTAEECREAMEKQQKRKPLYDRALRVLYCPDCGSSLQKVTDEKEMTTDGAIPHYCSNCGQAILTWGGWG